MTRDIPVHLNGTEVASAAVTEEYSHVLGNIYDVTLPLTESQIAASGIARIDVILTEPEQPESNRMTEPTPPRTIHPLHPANIVVTDELGYAHLDTKFFPNVVYLVRRDPDTLVVTFEPIEDGDYPVGEDNA